MALKDEILKVKRDHSNYLYHFTRKKLKHTFEGEGFDKKIVSTETTKALDVLKNIISTQKLIGSSTWIKGGTKCVCFSETPLHELVRLMSYDWWDKNRYEMYGVALQKEWFFKQGGRPVIYEMDGEEKFLQAGQNQHLHVRYSPGVDDFTWEREWRVKMDSLPVSFDHSIFIVPTAHEALDIMNTFGGVRAVSMELFL